MLVTDSLEHIGNVDVRKTLDIYILSKNIEIPSDWVIRYYIQSQPGVFFVKFLYENIRIYYGSTMYLIAT